MRQVVNTAKKLAASLRVDLGLSLTEPVDMTKVMMKTGVSLLKNPLQGKISGLYLQIGSVKVILINSAKSLGHQNFTMAHEFYHALYDESLSRTCTARIEEREDQSERLANAFASFFLMPEQGLIGALSARKAIGSPGLEDIIFLEQLYSVSHAAALCQLMTLKILTKHKAETFRHGVIAMARQLGFGDALYKPTNERAILSDYAEKAKLASDKGLITDARYRELLAEIGLSPNILRDFEDVE